VENHSGNATVPVIIQNSNLSQNHANFYGGAIGNYGTLKIINSTMDANTGEIRGGGIFTELFIHNTAGVTATNTTISDNVAAQDGGGIYAQGGQIELYNTTVAANHILVPTGVSYSGLGGGDLYRIRG